MSNGPPPMPAPVCLIENTKNGLQTVESALNLLQGIQQPVVVVAVVGLYRTGKSYLMNRLAGKQSGFALGSTIESKTKGIWMWCVPHPSKPEHTLVLLDTEGLGDVEKGDSKNDAWVFCLAVLLSSTLVYNSRGTIDNDAVEKLHYVTEITNLIQVKSDGASNDDDDDPDECEFVCFFPNFVWAVRDFTLERKLDNEEVSEDKYLEFALQPKKGRTKQVSNYNFTRDCIRNFFPTRTCFTFPFPTLPNNISRLESMAEADLDPGFLNVAGRFCSYIFAESRVKTIKGGQEINGNCFSHLVKNYVDTINNGEVPCLEKAVIAMAEIENHSAMNEALRLYEQGMEKLKKNFPVDLIPLSTEYQRLSTTAEQEFLKRSFKDDEQKYIKHLHEKVAKLYDQLINENMDASEKLCRKLLSDLYSPIAANIQQGIYSKPGGYEIYCRDRDAMVAKYRQDDKKGMKGEEMLKEFLQERSAEANAILKADERLTEADKKMAEARECEVVQKQQAMVAAQHQQDLQRVREYEWRSQEERIRRMEEKMEEEKRLQREELKRALESKLKEQQEMMEKGFRDKAEIMKQEIEQLKREKEKQKELDMEMEMEKEAGPGVFEKYIVPVAKIGASVLSSYLLYKVGLHDYCQNDYHNCFEIPISHANEATLIE
ncbi:guanylate-binding protein 3-like [Alosa pseudoharengus]|uniref:guanylate-binding protein 3-like n=1 Tax=Alosa pseudoharengus TaxID=34774 RepID=UPI003F8A9A1D